ncbi:MAG TPA: maleylpyruvate isomerase family mycothiol-dependent enzyme [Acidimicrobiales bacterium]|jgi:uncharacterized protein (TIGR03083 family)|nr:maleylpyruvate isomerase family mycothiol-dependent enzyme [Acidimicrobiales bacterium]
MDKGEIWPAIHAERAALASDLSALSEEQWNTPSLCAEWTVRDTLAHMTATAKISPPAFFGKMIGSGFSLGRMQTKDIAVERGSSPDDTLARFTAEVSSSKHPPGPTDTWLGETIIHAEDIRRPLGMAHGYSTDAAVRVAEFYKGSNLVVGAKKRVAGLKLQATDADWSHGDGPEVSGPIVSIVLAMTGRTSALDDLSGPGLETLRSRG